MGIAAYNRGSKLISEQFRAELAAAQNSLDSKAQLWASAMKRGMILQFRDNGGHVVTCGPNTSAVGPQKFAAHRYGKSLDHRAMFGPKAASCEGSAWSVALWVCEYVGRKRPFKVSA